MTVKDLNATNRDSGIRLVCNNKSAGSVCAKDFGLLKMETGAGPKQARGESGIQYQHQGRNRAPDTGRVVRSQNWLEFSGRSSRTPTIH
mmetsp:Transcript_23168/g.53747  ORF Transcript_23168/g.53747 Transcript_23168/m.53747 type:complete len:89 (+) Transcript_23168:1379-1645(+)